MKRYFSSVLFTNLLSIKGTIAEFLLVFRTRPPLCPRASAEFLVEQLKQLERNLMDYGFTVGRESAAGIKMRLIMQLENNRTSERLVPHPSYETVATQLQDLYIVVHNEMGSKTFTYIPDGRRYLFEQENLFGDDVFHKFQGAQYDIKEAGNCLAADLYTAAVFHLMRVAEIGMRALARRLRVKIVKQKREKRCPKCNAVIAKAGVPTTTPIDYALWDEVLQELKKRVEFLENSKKGPRRTRDFKIYHELLDDLQKFKNVDRNELMHTRRSYGEDEAMVVFNSVRRFMVTLSGRI